jgi:hypothetical protein
MASSANYIAEADKRQIAIGYAIDVPSIGKRISNVVITGVSAGNQEAGLVSMSWNPQKVSLDNANVSVGTLSVKLIDPSGTVIGVFANGTLHRETLTLGTVIGVFANGTLHRETLTLERGFGNLNVSDWNVLNTFEIYEISSGDQNSLTIKCRDRMTELKQSILLPQTYLTVALTAALVDATVDSVADFPSGGGTIFIDSESIPYGGTITSPQQFNALTRGTNAADHDIGAIVYRQIDVQDNPIDIMLQLMISPNGGVTGSLYDGLDIGLSIDESTIDVQSFEDVRDNSTLTGDVWKFEINENIPDLLSWLQREIFEIANLRITINDEGKFACSLLQEVTIDQLGGTVDESDILNIPSAISNSDRVINRISLKIDYNVETQKFENEYTYNDTDSQSTFGVKVGKSFESKGLKSAFDGEALSLQFANKHFRRVAQPFGVISKLKCLWKKQFFKAGDKVLLTHSKINNFTEGKVGLSNQFVEILSAKYDFEKGIVDYTINNSPNLSANFGFIAPSSLVASGTHTATVFDVEAGEVARAEWQAGYVVALWLKEGGTSPIATATVDSVSGDEITLSGAGFGTIPTTAHRIRYADFDDVISAQKAYAFFSDDNNDFPDGTASYKVS